MPLSLTDEQLSALHELDTPPICNAIERFNVRGWVEGFLGMDIRYLLPELGSMVGYAVTATVDSTTPRVKQDAEAWRAWLEALAIADQVVETARHVRQDEADLLAYLNGPEFSLEGYFKRRFRH